MKRFLNLVVYILVVHISALIVTGLFRLVLFFSSYHQLGMEALSNKSLSVRAFIHGVWFDNVIGCYILLLPLTMAVACGLCNYYGKALFRFLTIFFSLFYGLVYLISASDIPYFEYFFKHINSSIFEWFGYAGTTAGMILGESAYYLSIGLYFFLLACFVIWLVYLTRYFRKHYFSGTVLCPVWKRGIVALTGACLIGICVFGIRGRTGYNPIKVSAAYFCQDAFLNQLGVSPTFNLLTSVMDDMRPENKYLHLMDEQQALFKAKTFLNRSGEDDISPLAVYRHNMLHDTLQRHRLNVVLIMMESMSCNLMKHFGQSESLTPFLDSLYTHSISFRNFYSAGIHTNHGLYATLYSFPAIMKRNLMKGSVIPQYSGLPTVLKENGYCNLFFMTHEGQYDNMNAFFRTNGFDEVYSQEDYPHEKVMNSFGVQDDFLYQYAIPILNRKATSGHPFFATLLSISNHPPYVIPSYFHPKTDKPETQIVEYADWALSKFFEEARKQTWFDDTIFILEGDHGKLVGDAECELPQSYNHIPLMIYSSHIRSEERNDFGGQVDIQPTVLGMLGIDYLQNNFGVDLLKEKRPCMYYTADNMVVGRNDSLMYLYNYETQQEFTYHIDNGKLIAVPMDNCFLPLREYSFSMLQSAEYLVKHGKTVNSSETIQKEG